MASYYRYDIVQASGHGKDFEEWFEITPYVDVDLNIVCTTLEDVFKGCVNVRINKIRTVERLIING